MQGVCYKAKGLRTTTIEKCGGVKAKNTQCARWKPVDKCCTSLSHKGFVMLRYPEQKEVYT